MRQPAPEAQPTSSPTESRLIPRFQRSERLLHWALAIPFLLLYLSALMLLVTWGEAQPRFFHKLFGVLHRCGGVLLIGLPPLALICGRSQWREHLTNMREAWRWSADDVRWLILAPRAVLDHRVRLPEEGKFNAAEKLNFMVVSAGYPLYIATGLMVWMPGDGFSPWIAHSVMAVLGLPLIAGHIFMATVNPSTRAGLSGMVTGWVDREWARHHYRRWYREHFERSAEADGTKALQLLQRPAILRCGSCDDLHRFPSWERLLQRSLQVEPLFCPSCDQELRLLDAHVDPDIADAILRRFESGSVAPQASEVAH